MNPTDQPRDQRPLADIAAFLIERHYAELGCDRWTTRRVKLLCAKFGDTPDLMAARMRIRPFEFERRMVADCWTRQDGLILTMLERDIDLVRGGIIPRALLFPPPPKPEAFPP